MTQLPEEPPAAPEEGPDAFATGAVYGVLFIFGVVLGVIGGFAHAWYVGGIPAGALVCVIALTGGVFGTGRLMRTRLGAVVPAAGWLVISTLLTMEKPAGDVVIPGNLAGYLYLYGGAGMIGLAVWRTKSAWLPHGDDISVEGRPEGHRENDP